MAFCRLLFPILVLSVIQSYATEVPVFLWGDLARTSIKANPLVTVPAGEFNGILQEELYDDPLTVVFIEETLSVEDLSRKNSQGQTSFPYLRSNLADSVYLPSVENALRVLNKLANPDRVDHVKLTQNGLSEEIKPGSNRLLFISLKDAVEGESRAELLRRHNDFIENLFTSLHDKNDKVVAIYTARYPSWTLSESHSRTRRQAADGSTTINVDGLKLLASTIWFYNGTYSTLNNYVSGSTVFNNSLQSTTLDYGDNKVTLNFVSRAGYWYFSTLSLTNAAVTDEELYATTDVHALSSFSYRCGDNVTFAASNATNNYFITFNDLQVQPFFTSTNASQQFGDSFDCNGYFTAPIWACLFVVFILLSITFYGIMMMFDIRSMDRFDDPKGKTITINAGE